jgi:hypothetical protein
MGLFLVLVSLQLGSEPHLYLPEALRSFKSGAVGHANDVSMLIVLDKGAAYVEMLARLAFL